MEMNALEQEQQSTAPSPKPSIFFLFQHKCPRCRRGDLFESKSIFTKSFMKMPDQCKTCGQHFDLEPGFYYGAGYVSYALSIAFLVSVFVAWAVILGFSTRDNSLINCLIVGIILLIFCQPYIMRLARTIWLSFFVKYDPFWKTNKAEIPERYNESQKHGW